MTAPFVDVAASLGAAAVYVLANEEGRLVPDTSGNGRGPIRLRSNVQMSSSSARAAFARVGWFSGAPGTYGWLAWEAWMDLGDDFTWVVVARTGFNNPANQNRWANIVSLGDSWMLLRHVGTWGSTRRVQGVIRAADGSDRDVILSSFSYDEQVWHTFAVRSDAKLLSVWVDGRPEAEAETALGPSPGGPQADLGLGARFYQGGWDRFWRGHIAAVVAFPTALSAEQMQLIHDATFEEPVTSDALWRLWREQVRRFARLFNTTRYTADPRLRSGLRVAIAAELVLPTVARIAHGLAVGVRAATETFEPNVVVARSGLRVRRARGSVQVAIPSGFYDFEGDALGSVPAGWTVRNGGSFAVASGKLLRLSPPSFAMERFISADLANGAADVDITVRCRFASGNNVMHQLFFRVGGPDPDADSSYLCGYNRDGIVFIQRYTGTSFTNLATSSAGIGAVSAGSWWWLRGQIVGQRLRVKTWTGFSQPAGWDATHTDTSWQQITAGGYAGLGAWNGGRTYDYDDVTVSLGPF